MKVMVNKLFFLSLLLGFFTLLQAGSCFSDAQCPYNYRCDCKITDEDDRSCSYAGQCIQLAPEKQKSSKGVLSAVLDDDDAVESKQDVESVSKMKKKVDAVYVDTLAKDEKVKNNTCYASCAGKRADGSTWTNSCASTGCSGGCGASTCSEHSCSIGCQ
jgi:hypothetical protein